MPSPKPADSFSSRKRHPSEHDNAVLADVQLITMVWPEAKRVASLAQKFLAGPAWHHTRMVQASLSNQKHLPRLDQNSLVVRGLRSTKSTSHVRPLHKVPRDVTNQVQRLGKAGTHYGHHGGRTCQDSAKLGPHTQHIAI